MGFIIINSDGRAAEEGVMSTDQAKEYLIENYNPGSHRHGNLGSTLTTISNDNKKPTGSLRFNDQPVWHASTGNGEKSVSLFFYNDEDGNHCIIAMGEHLKVPQGSPPKYQLSDYGQGKHADFGLNRKI